MSYTRKNMESVHFPEFKKGLPSMEEVSLQAMARLSSAIEGEIG
jgi:hypothetical protein